MTMNVDRRIVFSLLGAQHHIAPSVYELLLRDITRETEKEGERERNLVSFSFCVWALVSDDATAKSTHTRSPLKYKSFVCTVPKYKYRSTKERTNERSGRRSRTVEGRWVVVERRGRGWWDYTTPGEGIIMQAALLLLLLLLFLLLHAPYVALLVLS